MGHKQYYTLYLDDYSCPSFTSGIKTYFGTLDEISFFIGKLNEDGTHENTVKAFHQYCNGQLDVTHGIAYVDHRLMEPVELIAELKQSLPPLDWEYLNPFECPYHVRVDSASVDAILIRHKNRYIRCIKASVTNFKYENTFCVGEPWHTLEGGFWGHPQMLAVSKLSRDVIIESRLYIPESYTDEKDTAVADFHTKTFDLNLFCEDIFGDG